MRVLFVIDHFGSGGAQRQMLYLAAGLKSRNYDIEFFIYYPDYSFYNTILDRNDFVVHEYRKRSRYSIRTISELYKVISRGNYDLILSFLRTPNTYCEIQKLLGIKIPLVISIRNTYPFGNISNIRFIHEQFHRLATHITVNSYYHEEVMKNVHPWCTKKISTIYNGVDLELFSPEKIKYNNTENANLKLIVIASTKRQKNLLGLTKAIILLKKKYNMFPTITWVGRISNNESDLKSYKESIQLIENNAIGENWKWLGERDDIPELLNTHDALILPSFYEGLPNVVCEAFASGRPVLVSNVCDHPRIVHDNITGLLFNPHEPEDIARKIKIFANMTIEERTMMGNNARIFAERNFSLNTYYNKYENLFTSIVRSKN
jgi:glycosyltransferase involved in cell wall biosynthesis